MFCRNCGRGGSDSTVLCHSCRPSIHMKQSGDPEPAGMSRIEIVILLFVLAAVASVLFVWSRSRLPVSGKFDRVLACGDGYYLVIKEADKGNEKMIGVADAEGRWIQPLSEYHIFLEKGGGSDISVREEKENTTAGDIYYINEGMFLMIRREGGRNGYAGIVYNARDNIGFIVRQYGMCNNMHSNNGQEQYRPPVSYKNGYWVILTGSGRRKEICIVDRYGHIRRTAKRAETLGQYSDGVFFADGCFYDLHLNLRLILKEYQIINEPYFQKGRSSLIIKTGRGEKYRVEIDRNGKLLKKPEKL